ncbi:MAG TPA: single-stranded DNA-binding protein [Bacteroidota bacterium]|nr:single-stranded DNA-binding protein [Bacteroidota bacterium]
MARGLNKVMLIGNLGKDPELKYTNSGIAVATFSVATADSWKDAEGNMQDRTEWHNIVAWRKLAEICGEYLKKGKKVYIEGKIQTRSYEKDGIKKYITEIVADQLVMLDGGGGSNAGRAGAEAPDISQAAESAPPSMGTEEDLPF